MLKLIESLEDFMIGETIKKLTKDLNLAFAERGREEGALPTDLWKQPVRIHAIMLSRGQVIRPSRRHMFLLSELEGELHNSETGDRGVVCTRHLHRGQGNGGGASHSKGMLGSIHEVIDVGHSGQREI